MGDGPQPTPADDSSVSWWRRRYEQWREERRAYSKLTEEEHREMAEKEWIATLPEDLIPALEAGRHRLLFETSWKTTSSGEGGTRSYWATTMRCVRCNNRYRGRFWGLWFGLSAKRRGELVCTARVQEARDRAGSDSTQPKPVAVNEAVDGQWRAGLGRSRTVWERRRTVWGRRGEIIAPILIVGVFVAVVLFLGSGLSHLRQPDESQQVLQPGDCTSAPAENTDYFEVEELPCTESHTLEVYAYVDLDPAEGDSYPGNDAAWTQTQRLCLPLFQEYVGTVDSRSEYEMYSVAPSRAGWKDGYTEGICLLGRFDSSGGLLTSTGSAKGSGG